MTGDQQDPKPRRIALLIGNARYSDERLAPLVVPAADVRALAAVLRDPAVCGFDAVQELIDADKAAVEAAIEDLFSDRRPDDLLLLYFSGHGVQDRRGWLYLGLPATRPDRPLATALSAGFVKDAMDLSLSRRQVLILDCCYSGAFAQGKDAGQGIGATVATPASFEVQGYGRVVLMSSTAAQRSLEGHRVIGETDQSLYTHYLVEGLGTGAAASDADEITVEQAHDYAFRRVMAHQSAQTPQRSIEGAQRGQLVIARNPRPVAALPPELQAALADASYHVRLGAVGEIRQRLAEAAVAGLDAQRQGLLTALQSRRGDERDYYVVKAIDEVLALSLPAEAVPAGKVGSPKVPDGSPAPAPSKESAEGSGVEPFGVFHDRLKDRSRGPAMVLLPAGRFRMGSPEDEPGRGDDERLHTVEVAAFAIGQFAVTFAEYDRFIEATGRDKPPDEGWGRGERPVINVSWLDALAYTEWLSKQTGEAYRLPTEAEWEYAARAGTETPFWTGDCIHTDQANYDGNFDYADCGAKTGVYRERTVPVGTLPANPWGLHEVLGNVWEWTGSAYDAGYGGGESRLLSKKDAKLVVLRGGSWLNFPRFLRAADRGRIQPDYRYISVGFRLARTLSP